MEDTISSPCECLDQLYPKTIISSTAPKQRLQIIVESKPGWFYALIWQITPSNNATAANYSRCVLACSNGYLMNNTVMSNDVETDRKPELFHFYTTSLNKFLDIEDTGSMIGQAMSSGTYRWLTSAAGMLEYSRCERAKEAIKYDIRTLVFVPISSGGVIEIGSLVEMKEDLSLIVGSQGDT